MTGRTRAVILVVVALTALVLVGDAVVSLMSGAYLNLGSGVWLALARDTADGVFYRPLWHGGEYGGTRYFPMLFVAAAALMRAGVPAVASGLTVSMLGLAGLSVAVAVLLRRLAVPSPLAALGTALAIAPYFVHQTAFAVRCEPIAAAFALFGLAAVVPMQTRPESIRRIILAAALFVCAFMTKVTCVYGPAAAIGALLLAGRRTAALTLASATVAGGLLFLAAIHVLSEGRAIESFRACALAGSALSSLLSSAAVTRPLTLIGTSHLLTLVFALGVVALAASRAAALRLPALYFLATAGITAVIFTSPGTILTSQIVDAYVAAIVLLTAVTARHAGMFGRAGWAALLGLTVWAAGQNVVRINGMFRDNLGQSGAGDRRHLAEAVAGCGTGPFLSESPLVPILGGQTPVVLDPFAFHVVALNRPEVGHDLVERVARREFACVVLEQDPETARGRAWYANVNLTGPVADAVLQHYTLDRTIAGERFYRAAQ